MNALRDAMSHAVLGWVKPELDETLRQARTEVEAFVEYPTDTSRMRFCAGYLHQVQGTLRMVELYAPAMVAEEMELLAQALQEGVVADRDEACATLMRGTVLLPDYLERLQNGHRDIPIVLLPLLNEIRAARGAVGLSESVLFAPDLNRPLPEQVQDASPLPLSQGQEDVADALEGFETALAQWPEGGTPVDPAPLASAAAELLAHGGHESTRRMLWVLASSAEALRDGALAADDRLRAAFAGIARAVRLSREGGDGLQTAQGVSSQEPTRQLLYLVAQSRASHPGLDALREAFDLDTHVPSQDELDHARGSLAGRNRSLLDTVGSVVKEELLRVKDALDLHLRTGGDVASLQPQADELSRVADTLGMLGLGVARDVVQQQRDALGAIARGEQPASESALLDIAGALLYVDASLDDQVARLGAPSLNGGEDTAALEARRTVEILAHEAISNFAAAREQFVAFIETNWDHARLHEVPRLLNEVAGALRILELERPAGYLDAVRSYIATELIGRLRVPSGRQLDTLADAMASLEYYLEALRDRRPNRDEILEIAHSSLESLGYWPPVEQDAAATEAAPAPEARRAVDQAPPAAVPLPAPQETGSEPAPEAAPVAFGWDTVELERPVTFAAPVEEESWTPAPVAFDAPERESIPLPALDIELPAIVPDALDAPEAPAALDVLDFTFDPVDAEQAPIALESDASWTAVSFDPVDAEHEQAPPSLSGADAPPLYASFDPVDAEFEAEPSVAAVNTSWEVPAFDVAALSLDEIGAGDAEAPTVSGLAWHEEGALADAAPPVADEVPVHAPVDAADVPEPASPAVADAEQPAVAAPSPSRFEPSRSEQWLDLTIRMQPAARLHTFESQDPPAEADPAASALIDEIALAAAYLPAPAAAESTAVPIEESVASSNVAADVPADAPALGGFDETGDIDAEIREVFLEEFDEELGNLGRLLPVWEALPHDTERLRPIRRVFHTLKGSGRLVGARALGEFSWKIESMLNRVLDGSRPASPAVLAMVRHACDVLPQFNAALRGQHVTIAHLPALEALAERIAAGEDVFFDERVAAPADAVPAVAVVASQDAAAAQASAADDGGTAASVDSVLREILEAEVAAHLETVDAWIASARQAPTPASEALLRSMHTMNGAFAMTDVPEITLATDPAETYIKRSLANDRIPDAEGVAALADTADAIRACIAALQTESPRIARAPALVQRLHALADALPDVRWPREYEEDQHDALDESAPLGLQPEGPADADDVLHAADDLSAYLSADALAAAPGGLPASYVVPGYPQRIPDGARALSDSVDFTVSDDATVPVTDAADITEAQDPASDAAASGDAGVVPAGDVVAWSIDDETIDLSRDARTDDLSGVLSAEAVDGSVENNERLALDPAWVAELDAAAPADPASAPFDLELDAESAAGDTPDDTQAAVETQLNDDLTAVPAQPADPLSGDALLVDDTGDTVAVDDAAPALAWTDDLDAASVPADAVEEPSAEAPFLDAPLSGDTGSGDETAAAEEPAAALAWTDDLDDAAVSGDADDTLPADGAPADAPVANDEVAAVIEEPAQATGDTDAAPVEDDIASLQSGTPAVTVHAPPSTPSAPAPVEERMLDFNELDRELVDIFVEEGGDLLDHIDHQLHALREDPSAREPVIELQRDLHTLKGGARMAGIATIGDLGHVIESLLESIAGNRTELQREDLGLLERGFDTLHQLLVRTRAHRATEMPSALIAAFEARIRGEAPSFVPDAHQADPADTHAAVAEAASLPETAATAQVPDVDADAPEAVDASGPEPVAAQVPVVASAPHVEAQALPVAALSLAPLSAPIEDEAVSAAAAEEAAARSPQEQVRVRADLLDNLVNHAGEVAIYRSRLEQQLGAFRSAMGELDRTNARLRDQLRRLDLETEAQIVARYQREQDSAEPAFDPLELDRFSTLQQLSRALNESAADLTGLQGVLDDLSRQYDVLLQQQSRVSSDLQDGLMSARMVPFDSVVPRLRRVVRQAGHDTGKQVQLKLDGTHGELDRNVLDRMVAPLEHMLRNSVAHGLELASDRRAAGKLEEGTITIGLRHEGSEIVLQVTDDGRGLDRAAIRRRAEQRGLIRADAVLTDAELDSVIFESGFSTSEQVSQLAGRGVGMDVVRNEVRQLGGTVEIASTPGKGVVFTLRLPQTLAVTQAVFVQIGETTYAVPVASVSGIGRIGRERFDARDGGYRYAGEEYALHDLGVLVGQASAKAEGQEQMPLLLVRAGDLRAAVAIDQVLGNREIVVKPVGLQISSVPGIYGATITGDGRVIVILDVAPLVRRHLAQPARPVAEVAPAQQRHVPLVMVVDDSLTMRKVTGRVLERHNFEVAVARDGVEALEKLEERVPDLMLLDIEMPRMDGYELATAMRADPRYRGVPIVMITSRTGEKHRQRAFEIGVQRYLGKPYQELDLMRNVYDLLGIARVRE